MRDEQPIVMRGGAYVTTKSGKRRAESMNRYLKKTTPYTVTLKNGKTFTANWKRISEKAFHNETGGNYKRKNSKGVVKRRRRRRRGQKGKGWKTDLLSKGARFAAKYVPKAMDFAANRISNKRIKRLLKSDLAQNTVKNLLGRHRELIEEKPQPTV